MRVILQLDRCADCSIFILAATTLGCELLSLRGSEGMTRFQDLSNKRGSSRVVFTVIAKYIGIFKISVNDVALTVFTS